MRRDPTAYVVALILVVLGSAAWLSRDPDHPAWDRLAALPGAGRAVALLRQGLRPAPPMPARDEPRVEYVYLEPDAPDPHAPVAATTARPLGPVWVRAGAELRQAPEPGSAPVEILPGLHSMTLLRERGEWRLVSRRSLAGPTVQGWVHRADLAEPSREELWQPEPVLPLAAAPPDEEALAEARRLMGGDARQEGCGPFRLVTDARGPLADRCSRLAGQLDGLYGRRTGLEPAGGAAEAILLFDDQAAYLLFRTRISPASRRHAFAAPARGFVALAVGAQPPPRVQATLVHELVHLLNRRYLGPALPAWLDEGLAEELAMSRIEADGTLIPGSLGGWQEAAGAAMLLGGGRVALDDLRGRLRAGSLPTLEELFTLDPVDFQADDRYRVHYSLSAFWVRYLLSGEAVSGGAGFRAFLAAVAAGRTLNEELFLDRLGSGWPELEAGFRSWLGREA